MNGRISLAGSEVGGEVSTVNGDIRLSDSRVKRNIETVNGNVTLRQQSVVEGDIVIHDTHGASKPKRQLTIRLEEGSVVEGDILVKDDNVEAVVYLSGDSKVQGRIENAEVVKE